MKIKKIAQVIGLSSALTLTAPMQASHATAAASGVGTPVAVFAWTFGSFVTAGVTGGLGALIGGGIALYCLAFDAEEEEIEFELPCLDSTSCEKLGIEKKEMRKYNHQASVLNCHMENFIEAASEAYSQKDRIMADQAIAEFKDLVEHSNVDIDFIKGIFAKIVPDHVNPMLEAVQQITH